MAVYTWGLTSNDIVIPNIAPGSIDGNSVPVTTTQLGVWITEGAGVANALLQKANITSVDGDWAASNPEAAEVIKAFVKAYVVERAAAVIGLSTVYDQAKARLDEHHMRIGTVPQVLGTAYAGTRTTDTDSIDDEPAEPWDFATMAGNVW